MARPKAKIDADQVEKLAHIGCTTKEIAGFFEVSEDTIERRFAGELRKGREGGKIRLRRLQLQAAEKLNPAILIWLGKQMLGQSDKLEVDTVDKLQFVLPEFLANDKKSETD